MTLRVSQELSIVRIKVPMGLFWHSFNKHHGHCHEVSETRIYVLDIYDSRLYLSDSEFYFSDL